MFTHRPDPAEYPSIVDDVLAWLDRSGSPDAYPEVRADRARSRLLLADARNGANSPEALAALVAQLGHAVLDDKLDKGEAASRMAEAEDRDEHGIHRIAAAAIRAADTRAWANLSGAGLVTDHLRPHIEALAEQAAQLVPKVAGIYTDESAIRSGSATASAWAALVEIAEAMHTAWRILDLATSVGLIERLPWANDLSPLEIHLRNPWARREDVQGVARPLVLGLVDDIEHDRQPTALTVSEAVTLRFERDGVSSTFTHHALEAVSA